MHGREQIGPLELAVLLLGFLVGSSLVLPMGSLAKQDAWLATLVGGGAGLAVAWMYTTLAQRFPGQSLIGYSKVLLGRWLGGLIGLLYIWYGFHLGALVLRNFGEFLVVTFLPQTPISALILALMLVCAYAVRSGLEALARSSQVLITLAVIPVLVITAMVAKSARLEYLLPVLEEGPVPVLQGAFSALGFPFGETVLFALILPFVRPVNALKGSVLWSMAAGVVLLAMVSARNVAVLGAHLVGTARFPALAVVQEVDIAGFLTRMDPLVVASWVSTGFIKVAICLYLTATGFAEWAGMRDYRPLVLPLGVLMMTMSILVYDNINEMTAFAATVWPVYSIPFQILIPLLLLGTAWLRGIVVPQSAPKGGRA